MQPLMKQQVRLDLQQSSENCGKAVTAHYLYSDTALPP